MDPATIIFATLLPLSLMSIPIFAIWTSHRHKVAELQSKAAGNAAQEEIEERLRILERIVTDKGYDVASQIEALRDKPRELDRQR
jgi:hypothetical protein